MVERERLLLPDTELSRPALVLAQRFVQRNDAQAWEQLGYLARVLADEDVPIASLKALPPVIPARSL